MKNKTKTKTKNKNKIKNKNKNFIEKEMELKIDKEMDGKIEGKIDGSYSLEEEGGEWSEYCANVLDPIILGLEGIHRKNGVVGILFPSVVQKKKSRIVQMECLKKLKKGKLKKNISQ